MIQTTTARELQRSTRAVMEQANNIEQPIIVIAKNKPVGAIIGLELLKKLQDKNEVK